MKHPHVCQICKRVRFSEKRPGAQYAPKICQQCQRAEQRYQLAKMMGRPVLPERR